MKRIAFILACAFIFGTMLACSDSGKESNSEKTVTALATYMAAISTIWEKKTAADVPTFSHSSGLAPSCSNCPGTNPEFAFFVKRGDPTKLMVFFMGGGACWNITNCVYNHTYAEDLFESVMLLGLVSAGAAGGQGVGGLLDTANPDNPFRDWTIVYVPYCTGDLNAGQEDYTYPDTYNPVNPVPVQIRHRGAVNTALVVQWMEENITPNASVTQLFVTGLSAGSYASLLAFPSIREVFSGGNACYLGDAGVGYAGVDADAHTFTWYAKNRWDVQLPAAVFGTTDIGTFTEYKDLVYEAVDYYRINKPDDRFTQYTTKYDATQAWFYNIQVDDHINYPNFWGSETGADPDLPVYQAWSTGMMDAIDIGLANYRYYIGAGTDHTIIFYNKTYTEASVSDGTRFIDWVDSLVNGAMPLNKVCADCDAPF